MIEVNDLSPVLRKRFTEQKSEVLVMRRDLLTVGVF